MCPLSEISLDSGTRYGSSSASPSSSSSLDSAAAAAASAGREGPTWKKDNKSNHAS